MGAKGQAGQALGEAVLVLGVLALSIDALARLASMQWAGLNSSHASRVVAFGWTNGERAARKGISSDRVGTTVTRVAGRFQQPGGKDAVMQRLRHEWRIADRGIVSARAAHAIAKPIAGSDVTRLRRHTSVLADAGHGSGDDDVRRTLAGGNTGWRQAADGALRSGVRVGSALAGIDKGWRREAPDFDWIQPWSDLIPKDRLSLRRGIPWLAR
jgi:hypothetical protein